MSSDLPRLIERVRSLADGLPVQLPSSEPVRRRARLRRRARIAASGLAVLLLGAAVLVPLRSLAGLGDEPEPKPGTRPWNETYVLSDFEVEYPLVVRPIDGPVERDPDQAGVRFRATWSGDVYPGEADCEIRVLDAGGNVAGTRKFSYASYGPSLGHPDIDVPVQGVVPAEGGAALSADGSCGPGTPPGTGEYRFANLHMEQGDNGARLAGDVTWATSDPPLDQYCVATLEMPDGTSVERTFTLAVGNNDSLSVLLPNSFVEAIPIGIRCEPFVGQGETKQQSNGVEPTAASTTRTVTVGGVSWIVARHDSPGGSCIGVAAEVDGQEKGQVGGGCGTSDNPMLRWGIGGLRVGGQWFNVAYGEVPAAASSVRVTLGDGSVRTDSGVGAGQGVWIVVLAGDPSDRASEVARIEVLDGAGSVIAHENPPSLVDLHRQAQESSARETASR